MIKLIFDVQGQIITRHDSTPVVANSVNYLMAEFSFSSEWEGLTKTAMFKCRNSIFNVLLAGGTCIVPHEVICAPGFSVSVFGVDGEVLRVTSDVEDVYVYEDGCVEGDTLLRPTLDVYTQIIGMMRQQGADAEAAQVAQAGAEAAQAGAEAGCWIVESARDDAQRYAEEAASQANRANGAANEAEVSKEEAAGSVVAASQAMNDLLAMLGKDIATLTGGKLTPSQIPAIAITDTFVVASEAAMLALEAQTGDVAIRLDENRTYILQGDNPSNLSGWQHMKTPTNYADMAGHAVISDEAGNAQRINGHRVVAMTQAQYDAAVKDPDTVYLVEG